MDDRCRCGEVLQHAYESWRCGGCRRVCCPECAEALDGVVRCLPCAGHPADARPDSDRLERPFDSLCPDAPEAAVRR
jgi:hypothetical protein